MTVIITMIKVLIIMIIITSFLQIINNKGKRAREKEEGRRGKRREIKLIYEWQLKEKWYKKNVTLILLRLIITLNNMKKNDNFKQLTFADEVICLSSGDA